MRTPGLTVGLLLAAAGSACAQLSPMNAAGVTNGHVHLNVADVEVHTQLWVGTVGGVVVRMGPGSRGYSRPKASSTLPGRAR